MKKILNLQKLWEPYQPYQLPIVIGTILRLIWAIGVPVMPVSDSHAYDIFAKNLANGKVYGWDGYTPTAYWPPGTSFIYSIFYRLFDHNYLPIVIFNILIGVMIIGVASYLAKKWFNPQVAIITAWILALWPAQIQFTTVLASELPFTLLMLWSLQLWLDETVTLKYRAIGVALILAIACYIRPTAGLVPFLLLFTRAIQTKEIFKTAIATVVMLLIITLLISPWSYRNTQSFGQFTTISTNGGPVLWMGNNPQANGGYMSLPPEVKGMNEAERNKYLKSKAVENIKSEPLLFIKRSIFRLFDTYNRQTISIAWNQSGIKYKYGERVLLPIKIINQIYWLTILGLSLIGLFLFANQQGWFIFLTHPISLMWGYFTLIHLAMLSNDRYIFPILPMIAIMAAFTLSLWLPVWKKQRLSN